MSKQAAFKNELEFCSNFCSVPHGIVFDGVTYPSVEHAYVAAKLDPSLRATTPGWNTINSLPANKVKSLGRKFKLRDNWDTMRLSVMEDCLRQKFSQGELKDKLLKTDNQYLEETNWWNDKFWGVCNGEGENNLGRLLMKIRHEIGGPIPHEVLPKIVTKEQELF